MPLVCLFLIYWMIGSQRNPDLSFQFLGPRLPRWHRPSHHPRLPVRTLSYVTSWLTLTRVTLPSLALPELPNSSVVVRPSKEGGFREDRNSIGQDLEDRVNVEASGLTERRDMDVEVDGIVNRGQFGMFSDCY
jgi:hypothetical protein